LFQINTPSADKNIYGNSQLNNAQDVGRGNLGNLSDHVALNSKLIERNTLLRISHFTLQDVEFLEELGEGAFGKLCHLKTGIIILNIILF